MTAKRLPFTPQDFKALDHDPETAAVEIFDYAPKTMDALIRLYCEAYADDYEPGHRRTETATLTGDQL